LANTYHHNSRISGKFRDLRLKSEGALITYLTGADPDPTTFQSNVESLVEGGADIVEIGIPFSDPIADGPVIQQSSYRALTHGVSPKGILNQIGKLSKTIDAPIVVLTYYNPVIAVGPDEFMRIAAVSGVNGIVVPDLPVEESDSLLQSAERNHVDTIFLASPNTSPERLRRIIEKTTGFLYLVSLFGVTGARKQLDPRAINVVKTTKKLASDKIPVAAGFGISTPDHVSTIIEAGASGAIVGSLLVDIVNNHLNQPTQAGKKLREVVSELKAATRARGA